MPPAFCTRNQSVEEDSAERRGQAAAIKAQEGVPGTFGDYSRALGPEIGGAGQAGAGQEHSRQANGVPGVQTYPPRVLIPWLLPRPPRQTLGSLRLWN